MLIFLTGAWTLHRRVPGWRHRSHRHQPCRSHDHDGAERARLQHRLQDLHQLHDAGFRAGLRNSSRVWWVDCWITLKPSPWKIKLEDAINSFVKPSKPQNNLAGFRISSNGRWQILEMLPWYNSLVAGKTASPCSNYNLKWCISFFKPSLRVALRNKS